MDKEKRSYVELDGDIRHALKIESATTRITVKELVRRAVLETYPKLMERVETKSE